MSAFSDAPRAINIGHVIQQLFAVLGRNFATFLVLAILMTGLPTAVIFTLQINLVSTVFDGGDLGPSVYWATLGGLVAAAASLILQGTLIHGAVGDMEGRPMSVSASLATGLRAFLPLFLILICVAVPVAFGCLLLIVPGVMLAAAWCVAGPAYVVEQTGVFDAIARSAELTRGNRWRIFGLFCLYIFASIVVEVVLGAFGGLTHVARPGDVPLVTRLVALPLLQTANILIGAVGVSALYVELRQAVDDVES